MEGTNRQTRALVLPTTTGIRIEVNWLGAHQGGQPTYWGVLCRSCAELVAFDNSPYLSFEAANMHPGAIRCTHGHNHLYLPRDFQFFFSDDPIGNAVMQKNRETYKATNAAQVAA
jgi:hypothetical protein